MMMISSVGKLLKYDTVCCSDDFAPFPEPLGSLGAAVAGAAVPVPHLALGILLRHLEFFSEATAASHLMIAL